MPIVMNIVKAFVISTISILYRKIFSIYWTMLDKIPDI